jgi:phage protein U
LAADFYNKQDLWRRMKEGIIAKADKRAYTGPEQRLGLNVDGVVWPEPVGLNNLVALNEFAHFLGGQLLAGISHAGS